MTNRKQLYNKIINNIAKGVRQTLNEDIQNFDVTQYDDDTLNHQDINNVTMVCPQTNEEFYDLIARRIMQNPEAPMLNDINTTYITNMSSIFYYTDNLYLKQYCKMLKYYDKYGITPKYIQHLDLSNWNMSNVTTIESMFNGCRSLKSVNLSNWDVSNIEDMGQLFFNCTSLEYIDLSYWNTKSLEYANDMFNGCQAIKEIDLSNFDTSNIIDIRNIIANCESLEILNLSGWNINSSVSNNIIMGTNKIKQLIITQSLLSKIIGNKNEIDIKII